MRIRCLALAMAVCGLLSSALGQEARADEGKSPTTHTVTIDSTSYTPSALVVEVGDTVVWVNEDYLVHTVTSKAGGFDSEDIEPGDSWKLTVTRTGTFSYVCTYHPPMQGELRVR